jgi:multidrug resistance efflux pump
MFANLVKKTKQMVGLDTEDYKQKYHHAERRAQEAEEKMMFLCKQLHSVMEQVDVCTKDFRR